MVLPKALKKELNNGLFLGDEIILLYLRHLEVLTPVTVKSKLPFLVLPERSCTQSPKNLEINGFEIME